MDDERAILQANEAFYSAFADADISAMVAIWAHEDEVACTHPGWNVLTGYHDVMESWRAILEGSAPPNISCRDARVFIFGDTGFVTCNEIVNGSFMVATNLFVRTTDSWAMVHHHAGPCAAPKILANDSSPVAIH